MPEKRSASRAANCRGLRLGGPQAVLHFNLGNVLLARDSAVAAVDHFRQAVAAEPAYSEAWNNLGVGLSELGDDARAEAAFRQALTINGCYVDALYNLADCLDQAGKILQARQYWRAYLPLDTTTPWASHARARLHTAPPPGSRR